MDNNFNNQFGGQQSYGQQNYNTQQTYGQQSYSTQQPYAQQSSNQVNYTPGYVQPGTNPGGTMGFAIASLCCGVASILAVCFVGWLGLVLAITGAALGGVSLATHKPGKGMAIAGVVCSIVTIVLFVVVIIAAVACYASLSPYYYY